MSEQPVIAAGLPRHRTRWRHVGKLVAINLALLLVVDLAVGSWLNGEVFPVLPGEKWCERDEELGFRPLPDVERTQEFEPYPRGGVMTIRHDRNGFRSDRDIARVKGAGTTRIAVVGDSHTSGILENADTYPMRLEQRMEERGVVEVINAGVHRYSPYQCYLRLRRDVLPFDPNIVIVAIYVGNDLLDLLRFDDRPFLELAGDRVEARPPEFVVYGSSLLPVWSERSFLYALYRKEFGYAIDRLWMLADLVSSSGGGWLDAVGMAREFTESSRRGVISQTLAQTVYFARYPRAEDKAFRLLHHVVVLHSELATQQGYDLRFLLLPSRLQVEPWIDAREMEDTLDELGLDATQKGKDDELYARAAELLEGMGRQVIDPLPALKAAAPERGPLYWYEFHLNVEGAVVVAEVIDAHLNEF